MARPWVMGIQSKKKLTIFPTQQVVGGMWDASFRDAVAEFNRLSRQHGLGVTFEVSGSAPDPNGEGGAEVQFDVGGDNGGCNVTFEGKSYPYSEPFPPHELHGLTRRFGIGGIRRAFIFVPTAPTINASIHTPLFNHSGVRLAGRGLWMYIAVHELIHAAGLEETEHTAEGVNGDVFTFNPGIVEGRFDRPDDDKFRVRGGTGPDRRELPDKQFHLSLSSVTAGRIRDNWR